MTTNETPLVETQSMRRVATGAKEFASVGVAQWPRTAEAHINGLADVVVSCAAEIERLQSELAGARRTAEYWKAEHLASNEQLAQAQKDAGRYRYLRQRTRAVRYDDGQWFSFPDLQPLNNAMQGAVCQHLDTAIDAAISQQDQTQSRLNDVAGTTREEIGKWFDRGVAQKATHMIVVCDTFDHDDYPAFATGDEDALKQYEYYRTASMQRVMEVYDLRQDKGEQLNATRVFRLPALAQ